jgi:hypothetical protein
MKTRSLNDVSAVTRRLSRLLDRLEDACSQVNTAEKTATEFQIEVGNRLIAIRSFVRQHYGKKATWFGYVKKKVPHLTKRTAQRWFRLAKNVDVEKSPAVAYLGHVRLVNLLKSAKGANESLSEHLIRNNIQMEIPSDSAAVVELRRTVDRVLKKSREDASGGPKSKPQRIFDKFVKATEAFITGADFILHNDDFIKELNRREIQVLKEKITALEQRQKAMSAKK